MASVISHVTSSRFPWVFASVLGGALLCSGLVLTWLTLWASRPDSRLGQFGIGSFLFLGVFVALFFGTVRWIVIESSKQAGWSAHHWEPFVVVTIVGLAVVVILTPIMLGMTEAVLWAMVWLIRRLPIRRRGRP